MTAKTLHRQQHANPYYATRRSDLWYLLQRVGHRQYNSVPKHILAVQPNWKSFGKCTKRFPNLLDVRLEMLTVYNATSLLRLGRIELACHNNPEPACADGENKPTTHTSYENTATIRHADPFSRTNRIFLTVLQDGLYVCAKLRSGCQSFSIGEDVNRSPLLDEINLPTRCSLGINRCYPHRSLPFMYYCKYNAFEDAATAHITPLTHVCDLFCFQEFVRVPLVLQRLV